MFVQARFVQARSGMKEAVRAQPVKRGDLGLGFHVAQMRAEWCTFRRKAPERGAGGLGEAGMKAGVAGSDMAPVNGYFAYHVDLGTGIQAITPAFGTGSRAAAGGKRYWSLG